MATYSTERIKKIIDAFEKIDAAHKDLEKALVAADPDEYGPRGKDFIGNLCCFAHWIEDPIRIYRAEVFEASAEIEADAPPAVRMAVSR